MSAIPIPSSKAFRALAVLMLAPLPLSCAASDTSYKFDFGSGAVADGYASVTPETRYSLERGFGFVSSITPEGAGKGEQDALRGDACVSSQAFTFAVDVPEGNYDVEIIFGSPDSPAQTTVKAEARRLMLHSISTEAGETASASFTVNRRSPTINSAETEHSTRVSLNSREQGPPVIAHWDEHLTIEFLGNAAVAALTISPASEATTVFVAGDSTVTDQRNEPWAGWGQMLPAFFKPGVAIANHAESGRALYSFKRENRLEKILSVMQRGDYLFIQFGHNDQKNKSEGAGPFTTYQDDLREYIKAVRGKGGIPVLVTPMERRRWSHGKPGETLTAFAKAMRQVGEDEQAPVIDLHAMSLELYAALGETGSKKAFVHFPANTYPGQEDALSDNTHHSPYGAYQLARAVVKGIREKVPALAAQLRDNVAPFDPAKPDSPEKISFPISPVFDLEKPEGN